MLGHEKNRQTSEECLAWERKAEFKNEFYGGVIHPMSGASRDHNRLTGGLYSIIRSAWTERPCEVFLSMMRVHVRSAGLYAYPDIVAVCGEPQFQDEEQDTPLNPTLIVEVASPATEAFDRGAKFHRYMRLPSLTEYTVVSTDCVSIFRFVRRAEGWLLTISDRRDDVLWLESVGCKVALRELYHRVDVPETTYADERPPESPLTP